MHCITANSGVTQHEVNQFILRTCQRKGLPVGMWDDFHQTIEGMGPLRPDFFQSRVVNDDTAHLKGMAADTLAAMDVIGLFILIMFDAGDFVAWEVSFDAFGICTSSRSFGEADSRTWPVLSGQLHNTT